MRYLILVDIEYNWSIPLHQHKPKFGNLVQIQIGHCVRTTAKMEVIFNYYLDYFNPPFEVLLLRLKY